MLIQITETGVRLVYTEDLDLEALAQALGGELEIRRASHVEPSTGGVWTASMEPMGGPVLGPFPLRSEALEAETDWLQDHLSTATPFH